MTQTAGADIYNLANYTTLSIQENNRIADASVLEARVNVRDLRILITEGWRCLAPAEAKTGKSAKTEKPEKPAKSAKSAKPARKRVPR